jgi:hypothetical protein
MVVENDGGAAEEAEQLDDIAVAYATRILTSFDVEPLLQASFNVPLAADVLQDFGSSCWVWY